MERCRLPNQVDRATPLYATSERLVSLLHDLTAFMVARFPDPADRIRR